MIEPADGGVLLAVRVVPRAGRSGLAGIRDDAALVRLGAAPVDGAANAQLVEMLATVFGVPRRQVTIVSGERTRHKRVRILGVTAEAVLAAITASGERR